MLAFEAPSDVERKSHLLEIAADHGLASEVVIVARHTNIHVASELTFILNSARLLPGAEKRAGSSTRAAVTTVAPAA
jgi:hypothetical protein